MAYKYLFFNDYSEGAHPKIIDALVRCNAGQEPGYGNDEYSIEAANLIKARINKQDAEVYFVSGGTQANVVVLASILRPHEAVIAASSAHIAVHEAGAIEAIGHKVIAVPSLDGKLTAEDITRVLNEHIDEHMVKPRAVFISQATEAGTIYKKAELEEISELCKQRNLYLYIDGARIGSSLVAKDADLTLADIAALADVFYIGGTKNGALFGEAIVIVNPTLKESFKYHLKQRGALLAKGRAVGVQFLELFTEDLFFDCARHANAMAEKLSEGIRALGYDFASESTTNQLFPIFFSQKVIEAMQKSYGFYVWSKIDETKSVVRLVTSWATPEAAVKGFLEDLKEVI